MESTIFTTNVSSLGSLYLVLADDIYQIILPISSQEISIGVMLPPRIYTTGTINLLQFSQVLMAKGFFPALQ